MILKILGHNPIYVVENKNSAIIALIFVLTWRLVGYAMIMILAGLKSLALIDFSRIYTHFLVSNTADYNAAPWGTI